MAELKPERGMLCSNFCHCAKTGYTVVACENQIV